MAKHTGVSQLEIEVRAGSLSDGIDWIYQVDFQLRNARSSKIDVNITVIFSPDSEDSPDLDNFRSAVETIA
jgi:hypothetical protein